MTWLVARIHFLLRPCIIGFAIMADRFAFVICDTLGRTTNPVLLAITIITASLHWLRGIELRLALPHILIEG